MPSKKYRKNEITFNVSKKEMAELKNKTTKGSSQELADRSDRLLAALIDLLPIVVVILLFLLFAGLFFLKGIFGKSGYPQIDEAFHSNFKAIVRITGWGFAQVFGLVNTFLLWTRAQTIGKYYRSIRIVNNKTGDDLDLINILVLRPLPFVIAYAFFLIASISGQPQYEIIPVLFMLFDVLFIFRSDRRCIHDLISGAKVVKCENTGSLFDTLRQSGLK